MPVHTTAYEEFVWRTDEDVRFTMESGRLIFFLGGRETRLRNP